MMMTDLSFDICGRYQDAPAVIEALKQVDGVVLYEHRLLTGFMAMHVRAVVKTALVDAILGMVRAKLPAKCWIDNVVKM